MKRNKNDCFSEAGLVAYAPRSVASGGWPVQDPGHVSYGAEEEAVKHENASVRFPPWSPEPRAWVGVAQRRGHVVLCYE